MSGSKYLSLLCILCEKSLYALEDTRSDPFELHRMVQREKGEVAFKFQMDSRLSLRWWNEWDDPVY
jgi:hypothetical protein